MKSEEMHLIKKLFEKLKEIEETSGIRDKEAEKMIFELIDKQKKSPYYMAQSILLQEEIINQLRNKNILLEKKINKINSNNNENKSFLGNLFNKRNEKNFQNNENNKFSENNHTFIKNKPSIIDRGLNFMSGALQTAAGVAGGVFLGNFLNNIFDRSSKENYDSSDNNFLSDLSDNKNSFFNENFNENNLDTFNYGDKINYHVDDEPFSENYLDDDYMEDDDNSL